jgi:zinc transporter
MNEKSGLVFSYILDGAGGGHTITWEDIKHWIPEKGVLWLHLDYKNEEVQKWLNEASGLNLIIYEALLEEETRPRAVAYDDGLLLILRGVNCNPGSDPEDMVSLRMWFDKDRIITMRHRRVMAIDDINRAIESSKGPTSPPDFLVRASEHITDRMGDVVSEIDDHVDELEDTVLTAESYELRSKLAVLRRKTISLRRYIAPQRDVLTRLQNERVPWLRDLDKVHLRELAERTARFVEDLDSARDRAAITQEELNGRLSEHMSKTLYILSLVAAVFLPLGFITGLLGINVGGIPGSEFGWAFLIVCIFLAAIAFVEFWLFKRKKWL